MPNPPLAAQLIALSVALAVAAPAAGPAIADSAQGWGDRERHSWYRASQGSRLVPETWFRALERAEESLPFSDPANMARYGFVRPPDHMNDGLPIGFATDRQDDSAFTVTGLRWYNGQKSDGVRAEPWIGLNCSACHTAEITYEGERIIVDGGPGLLDFQTFIEEFDRALRATANDSDKWDRFRSAVLGGRNTPENAALLREALDSLLAWQAQTEVMNDTPIRYGYGRLDAVGHIFNKVLVFNGSKTEDGNPPNAPVSYPFLWDIWRQEQVQWNGVASNSRFQLPGDSFEYGALGRNTGEVLGVFGEVILTPSKSLSLPFSGYTSSVQTENLAALERVLRDLEAPRWPDAFPPIDPTLADEGRALFRTQCAACHKTPDMQVPGEKTEVMVTFEETLATNPADLTDIWMACNVYIYSGASGVLQGADDLEGNEIGPEAPVANMLAVAVRGTLLGDKAGLVKEGFRNFFGIRRLPQIFESTGEDDNDTRAECEGTIDQPLLAYKARPLDGIWSTAPYLHNGSVASLYELLLPAEERRDAFWVGSSAYDPQNVGYMTDAPSDGKNGFLLRTRDADGTVIEGNANAGHEYGADSFTERERRALVEYMKTL